MALKHWFLPHEDTHKKAHLISWEGLLIYIMLFILLQVGFSIISYTKPGVLGISGNIDQKRIIELTNIERQKAGLGPVTENGALDKAADSKAMNMFEENYWAHFAPSGKTPWDFMLGAGYKFTYAGENLAKNFSSADEVVKAWMASPTHRANLLNSKYQDIGIAVKEGTLNGQQTILVVQEFGTTAIATAQKPTVDVQGKQVSVPEKDLTETPRLISVTQQQQQQPVKSSQVLIDPYSVSKYAGILVLSFIVTLLVIDVWVLKKRGVFRFSSHHIAHMALISLAAGTLVLASPGAVL